MCRQYKKEGACGKDKISSDKLISFFKRSQFCFRLNTVIVVVEDVFGYEEAGLLIGGEFDSVNAFSFENGEEIFG